MTTKYYEWGVVGGGGGGTVPASSPYGPPEEFAGTLGAGVTTIAFSHDTKRVTLRNTHDSQSLDYSFDSGATYLTAGAGQVIQEWVSIDTLLLQPSVGGQTPTYEITAVLTE